MFGPANFDCIQLLRKLSSRSLPRSFLKSPLLNRQTLSYSTYSSTFHIAYPKTRYRPLSTSRLAAHDFPKYCLFTTTSRASSSTSSIRTRIFTTSKRIQSTSSYSTMASNGSESNQTLENNINDAVNGSSRGKERIAIVGSGNWYGCFFQFRM